VRRWSAQGPGSAVLGSRPQLSLRYAWGEDAAVGAPTTLAIAVGVTARATIGGLLARDVRDVSHAPQPRATSSDD